MTETAAIDQSKRRALSYPDFRAYIMQRLLTTLGISIQSVIVGWQVFDITHSPFDLGLVGLMQFAPNIGLALFAGQLADRMDRRFILRGAIFAEMLCSLGLIVLTLAGNRDVVPIYALLIIFGAARAFMAPASQSVVPKLVHSEALGSAIALGSSMFMIAQMAGPALGGLLYGFGATAAFGASFVFFGISLLATIFIRIPLRPESQGASDTKNLLAGVRFIWQRPAILGAISLDLFAVLFGGATALMPVYARDILAIGPIGLGILRASPAIGAFCMAIFLAHRSLGDHTGIKMLIAVGLFGVATIVFGISKSFPLSILALILLGASDMVSVFLRTNLVQRSTPDDMRGRVSSVNWVFIGASNELGEMESGFTASLFGSSIAAVVAGGIGTLCVVALWSRLFPALRGVRRIEQIEAG